MRSVCDFLPKNVFLYNFFAHIALFELYLKQIEFLLLFSTRNLDNFPKREQGERSRKCVYKAVTFAAFLACFDEL